MQFLLSIFFSFYDNLFSGFLNDLKEVKKSGQYDFFMRDKRSIRLLGEVNDHMVPFCPITAVAHFKTGKFFGECEYNKAGETIGISRRNRENIADAADGGMIFCSLLRYRIKQILET